MMSDARTKMAAMIGAAALSMTSGAAHARSLIESTVSFGFYVSGDFIVDAIGNTR